MKALLFLFILCSQLAFSQEDTLGQANRANGPVMQLLFGKKMHQTSFYNQTSTLKEVSFTQPINVLGLGCHGGFNVGLRYHYAGHILYAYVLPQEIRVDSLVGKLTGFYFSASVAGFDVFKKNEKFDFICSIGFTTGRLKINRNELLRQKNGFVAPMASTCLKVAVGKIVLGINAYYDYAINAGEWRKTIFANATKAPIANFKQTGLTTLFFIGKNV